MSIFTGMWAELGVATKELTTLPTGKRLKQLAFRGSPLFVAAAAGAGSLCIRKMQDPPEEDFLGSRATFRCTPMRQLVTRQDLAAAGGDAEALCRAARRMRGPIERDLAAAECLLSGAAEGASEVQATALQRAARALGFEAASGITGGDFRRSLLARLVEAWQRDGYFSEPVEYERPMPSQWKDGVNPVTSEDETYGRDVGCEVPLCMLRGQGQTQEDLLRLGPGHLTSAAEALEEHGVVRLSNFLPRAQVGALRRKLEIHSSALDTRSRQGVDPETGIVREYDPQLLQDADPELDYVVSAIGRKHFTLRGRLLEEVVRDVQAGALPLIWEHLASASPCGSAASRRPYVSEVQLLVTEPGAVDQFWHVDNAARGLTLIVPLTPIPEEMAPNLFMLGSHHLFEQEGSRTSRLSDCAASLLASDGAAVATMEAGDALVYDSRVIHRSVANRRYNHTGIALAFRYDFDRPPGHDAFGTIFISWTGNLLAGIMRFYARLPSKQ